MQQFGNYGGPYGYAGVAPGQALPANFNMPSLGTPNLGGSQVGQQGSKFLSPEMLKILMKVGATLFGGPAGAAAAGAAGGAAAGGGASAALSNI